MDYLGTILTVSLGAYALATGRRRPWLGMLGLFFLTGIGLVAYLLFGRDREGLRQAK